VTVTTKPLGGGRLQITVALTSNQGFTPNVMAHLRFGSSPAVEVERTGFPTTSSTFVWNVPTGTTQVVFTLHRIAPGAVQLPFLVTDNCGDWQTFVGGGPDAF
jgi:hypothetical protein